MASQRKRDMETYFRYVPHIEREHYESMGWTVVKGALEGTHHGRHAVLMTATTDTIKKHEHIEDTKVLCDLELYVGDLMGEVIDTIGRCGDEGYLSKSHVAMLTEMAIELAEQWEEDLEMDRRAKND